MQYEDGRRVKVYFFVMVLCRSRKKYIWFSKVPFTSELAIYAHEKAFEYYGGKPLKIINDKWVDGVDKDVLSSLTNLLNVVRHIIDDEQTPEIIKMMECDLLE